MIKSELMSRRRAEKHICHSETDVAAPPAQPPPPSPISPPTPQQSLTYPASHAGPFCSTRLHKPRLPPPHRRFYYPTPDHMIQETRLRDLL